MSKEKIGDYIHLHRKNFENSGIHKTGKNYNESHQSKDLKYFITYREKTIDRIIKLAKSKNTYTAKKRQTKTFENLFTSIMSGKEMKYKGQTIFTSTLRQQLLNNFLNKVNNKITSSDIGEYGKIGVGGDRKQLDRIAKEIHGYRAKLGGDIDTEQKTQKLNVVKKHFETLMRELGSAAIASKSGNLKDTVDKIYVLFNSLVGDVKSLNDIYIKNKDGSYSVDEKYLSQAISELEKLSTDGEIKDVNFLNNLYDLYNYFKSPATSLMQGDFAEDVGELASYIMQYDSGVITNKMLSGLNLDKDPIFKGLGRQHSPTVYFDIENDLKLTDERAIKILKDEKIINSNNQIQITFGQQKIDIELRDTVSGLEEGVSVKSYDLSNAHWMGLVSDTNLLTILLSEGVDFANHYLNAQAAIYDCPENSNEMRTKEKMSINANYIQQSNEALKIVAIETAFKGTNFDNHKRASLFLVNDVSTGRVKLFNINELIISLLKQNGTNQSNAFSIWIGEERKTDMKTLKIDKSASEKVDVDKIGAYRRTRDAEKIYSLPYVAAQVRIANIIADAHKKKVNVKVNAHAISNRMN